MGVLNFISLMLLLMIGAHAIYVLKFNSSNLMVEDKNVFTEYIWDVLVTRSKDVEFLSGLKNYKRQVIVFNIDVQNNTLQLKSLEEKQSSIKNNKMRSIIDSVFKNIHSMVLNARPDLKDAIGDIDKPNNLSLTMDMFPCYRSILDKISKICFSLPQNPYSLKWLTNFADLCVIDKQINQVVNELIEVACVDIQKLNIKNVF